MLNKTIKHIINIFFHTKYAKTFIKAQLHKKKNVLYKTRKEYPKKLNTLTLPELIII